MSLSFTPKKSTMFRSSSASSGRSTIKSQQRSMACSSTAADTAFSLTNYLSSRKELIEEALAISLPVPTQFNKRITESMYYSLMAGGKRIRPVITLATYDMINNNSNGAIDAASKGTILNEVMPTACAIEMIHTMSLIHDDLPAMDNDSLRRGKPTNHVLYGDDVAILAGDALLSYAFEHVATSTKNVKAENVVTVLGMLGGAVGPQGLAGGQVLDLECEKKHDASLEELQWIHTHKTATLLEVSCSCGGVIAGATEAEVAALAKFSRGIGLAFQVADDILDCTATSEELGKTAGKDEEVDKTTYVKLLGLEGAKLEVSEQGGVVDDEKYMRAQLLN